MLHLILKLPVYIIWELTTFILTYEMSQIVQHTFFDPHYFMMIDNCRHNYNQESLCIVDLRVTISTCQTHQEQVPAHLGKEAGLGHTLPMLAQNCTEAVNKGQRKNTTQKWTYLLWGWSSLSWITQWLLDIKWTRLIYYKTSVNCNTWVHTVYLCTHAYIAILNCMLPVHSSIMNHRCLTIWEKRELKDFLKVLFLVFQMRYNHIKFVLLCSCIPTCSSIANLLIEKSVSKFTNYCQCKCL